MHIHIEDRLTAIERALETIKIELVTLRSHAESSFSLHKTAFVPVEGESGHVIFPLSAMVEIINYVNSNQMINAIKCVRVHNPSLGLREAKNLAEGIRAQLTISAASR